MSIKNWLDRVFKKNQPPIKEIQVLSGLISKAQQRVDANNEKLKHLRAIGPTTTTRNAPVARYTAPPKAPKAQMVPTPAQSSNTTDQMAITNLILQNQMNSILYEKQSETEVETIKTGAGGDFGGGGSTGSWSEPETTRESYSRSYSSSSDSYSSESSSSSSDSSSSSSD